MLETPELEMSVSVSYRQFVLEQLSAVAPVSSKSMFGGVGVYSRGLFFGLMDDDRLYFKVDDSNRGDFEAKGMGAFYPFKDERAMGYFEVPEDVLEEAEELTSWMNKALKVAASKSKKKKIS
jgi:DNA transformation protein